MEKWTKTDKFIELLNDAIASILWPAWFGPNMDKERTIENLTKQYFVLYCHLFGVLKITLGDDDKEAAKQFLKKNKIKTEPYWDIIYDVLKADYPNYKDLGTELWELCPNVDALPQYIQISRGKFKELLESVPDKDYYSLVNLFDEATDNDITKQVRECERAGVLNAEESKYILTKVCDIVELINLTIDAVAKGYNDLQVMAGINKTEQKPRLPEELQKREAQNILKEAVKAGLCTANYEWLKGVQLAACFAQQASSTLNLGKGVNSDGTQRISWKPFEKLFGFQAGKLRAALNDIKKTGQNPSDIKLVDDIFTKLKSPKL